MCICALNKQKNHSFKSAPKVVFTLYKGTVGSLELTQKGKVVKNFEKKKRFLRPFFREICPISLLKFINRLFSNLSTV